MAGEKKPVRLIVLDEGPDQDLLYGYLDNLAAKYSRMKSLDINKLLTLVKARAFDILLVNHAGRNMKH